MRGTAANAIVIDSSFKGADYIRMICQTQLIITAKINDIFTVDLQIDALWGSYDASGTIQALRSNSLQITR